ncbi:unnamed protein product, partial [Onchocerca ochengi]
YALPGGGGGYSVPSLSAPSSYNVPQAPPISSYRTP